MTAAAAAMAPFAWVLARVLEDAAGTRGLPAQLVTGLGPVLAGVVVYGLAARLMRIPEVETLARGLRRAG